MDPPTDAPMDEALLVNIARVYDTGHANGRYTGYRQGLHTGLLIGLMLGAMASFGLGVAVALAFSGACLGSG